ncbi:MAG: type III pantothenate kinase [Gemmatimonadota bacterium]|nr:type III pantothenate kinase [Gemmatimonadota bacterium]
MQLVVDVGNTETVVGLTGSAPTEIQAHWRVSTAVPRTVDELSVLLRAFLEEVDGASASLTQGVVGSVVPAATRLWTATMERIIPGGDIIVVDPSSDLPIRLDVDEPMTVGADRIVNTLAAREMFGRDTIAVDLGTATTYDCITADGVFVGGVISPGLSAGLEWLGKRTAKLPLVELQPPESVIGRRTETCIQSGVFFPVVDGVDRMVERIKDEWGRPDALVVATGGFAAVLGPHLVSVDRIEPFLTLYGLALAGVHLTGK